MTVSRTIHAATGSAQSGLANGLSRRRFVRAAAAAGAAYMLSLRLPFAGRDAAAADANGFAPNAFIRIPPDGAVVPTIPMSKWARAPTPPFRC